MIRILSVCLFLICFSHAHSQQWEWANSINVGDINHHSPYSASAVDDNNCVIVAGFFGGKFAIGNDTLDSNPPGFYLAKFDQHGDALWAKKFEHGFVPVDAYGGARITRVSTDGAGNIYLAGFNYHLPTGELFIKKFSNVGDLIWTKVIKGRNGKKDPPIVHAMQVDHSGNLYAAGSFYDSLYVEGTKIGVPNSPFLNLFVLRFDANANLNWVRTNQIKSNLEVSSGAIDANFGFIFSGTYFGYMSFGGFELGNPTPRGSDNYSYFVTRVDSSGTVKWLKGDVGRTSVVGDLKLGENGNSYLSLWGGGYTRYYDTSNLCGPSDSCVFNILVIDSLGSLVRNKKVKFLSGGWTSPPKISVDKNLVYVSSLGGAIKFDDQVVDNGGIYVALLDSLLTTQWINMWGQVNDAITMNEISNAPDGGIFLTGEYQHTITLGSFEFTLPHSNTITFFGRLLKASRFVKGVVFNDLDSNGVMDPGEPGIEGRMVKTVPQNSYHFTNKNGEYSFPVDGSATEIKLVLPRLHVQTLPAGGLNYSIPALVGDTIYTDRNFGLHKFDIADLRIFSSNLSWVRPGTEFRLRLKYGNYGTQPATGTVHTIFDTAFADFISSSISPDLNLGDSLVWTNLNLQADEERINELVFRAKTNLTLGQVFYMYADILPIVGDTTPVDNRDTSRFRVVTSYDPNEKVVNRESVTIGEIQSGAFINYTICFQNTGNDTAFNIVIRDTIPSQLDMNTFEMVDATHEYKLRWLEGGVLEWTFLDVKLVDSFTNESGSHGFVRFKIKLMPGTSVGTTVENNAAIFFDYNQQVLTNEALTNVINILPLSINRFSVQKRNEGILIAFLGRGTANAGYFDIEKSGSDMKFTKLNRFPALGGTVEQFNYLDKNPLNGWNYYRIKSVDENNLVKYTETKAVNWEKNFIVTYRPNPVQSTLWLGFDSADPFPVQITLTDLSGRIYLQKEIKVPVGRSLSEIDMKNLSTGIYFIKIKTSNSVSTLKVLKSE